MYVYAVSHPVMYKRNTDGQLVEMLSETLC